MNHRFVVLHGGYNCIQIADLRFVKLYQKFVDKGYDRGLAIALFSSLPVVA